MAESRNYNNEAADLFYDLEKQFEKQEGARRRKSKFVASGIFVGLVLVVVGMSVGLLVSLAGYGLMLVCGVSVAEQTRDKVFLKVRQAEQRALDRRQQSFKKWG